MVGKLVVGNYKLLENISCGGTMKLYTEYCVGAAGLGPAENCESVRDT